MAAAMGRLFTREHRVLVAEDHPDHRVWLTSLLRDQGYEVVMAHDGRELLDMLASVPSGHFELVVCDQMMPGLRGTECLARASARSRWIIVTASQDPAVDQIAAQFGALGVLRKPFDAPDLMRLVEKSGGDVHGSGVHPKVTADDDDEPPHGN